MIWQMIDGAIVNEKYDQLLADYAQKNTQSEGREHAFVPDPLRTPYQRDRSRIIHSSAFRRLKGKTQVVPPETGDHFRNRLTHTLEVASISRDLARLLGLNEDLTECLGLSHDLGHPPFGHAGEQTLNEMLKPFGKSFEHNEQSLRVVRVFSHPYGGVSGLNLSREILKGLQKHEKTLPFMEAELVDLADEIAYLSADVEDGLRGGFINLDELKKEKVIIKALDGIDGDVNRPKLVRLIIGSLMRELYTSAKNNIAEMKIKTQLDFAQSQKRVVVFSPEFTQDFTSLKKFLFQSYYLDKKVNAQSQKGQDIIRFLFGYLLKNPSKIPNGAYHTETSTERQIADYIAGMTNAYALAKFNEWN